MTNVEKYLKDGVSIEELIFDIINFEKCWNRKDFDKEVKRIKKFFFTSLKPTLTEDERVILRNIKIHDCSKVYSLKITRACDNDLWLKVEGKSNKIKRLGIFIDINGSISIDQYSHLFQFIKERRRIRDKRIVRR